MFHFLSQSNGRQWYFQLLEQEGFGTFTSKFKNQRKQAIKLFIKTDPTYVTDDMLKSINLKRVAYEAAWNKPSPLYVQCPHLEAQVSSGLILPPNTST